MSAFRWKILAGFAAVYLIWGSTYLAIRYAIETLPPFTMAGVRFVVAGSILYLWARWRGARRPLRRHWSRAWLIGALLLLVGNGGVVWAERLIPSGLTALFIATEPLWIVILDWLRPGGMRPVRPVVLGLILGFAGTALLFAPWAVDSSKISWLGATAVLLASFSWAAGSLVSIRAEQPAPPFLATGMQMLCGGTLLLLAGLITSEWTSLNLAAASLRSSLAFAYLFIFGSLIAFSAYVWLLRVTTPARVSTYAYVNPVVAVFLGWLLAGEIVTLRMILAAAVIIAGVVLITRQTSAPARGQKGQTRTPPASAVEEELCTDRCS
jgi:drug/metabolite transporter (DMT)-like permease